MNFITKHFRASEIRLLFSRNKNDILLMMSNEIRRPQQICVIGDRWGKGGRDRLSGVLRYSAENPEWTVNIVTLGTPGSVQKLKQILDSGTVDHLIILSCDKTVATILLEAQKRHLISGKTMTVDLNPVFREMVPPCQLDLQLDAIAIARTSIKLLLKRGYTSIAYVGYAPEHQLSNPRRDELRRIALADGIPFSATDNADNIERLAEWLKTLPRPCGVVTYYDLRSRDVLDACNLAQLRVPEQIGIIGSDDDASICEATIPSLTSVLPDFERSTYLATAEFAKLLEHRRPPKKPLRMTYAVKSVSERESTMDFRGGGLLVSTACEYIRSHAVNAITVQSVANHCRVSRRLLELRFREINECTVREEIERARLKKVCSLLRETRIPISEIAHRSGFSSQTNLAALFRKRFNCSMRDFRNKRA